MKDTSLFKAILDNVSDGIYFVDREKRITLWNRAAGDITGYDPQEMAGQPCREDVMMHTTAQGFPLQEESSPLARALYQGAPWEGRLVVGLKVGGQLDAMAHVLPVFSGGEVAGVLEIFRPFDAGQVPKTPLESQEPEPERDPLTGLLAKNGIIQVLRQAESRDEDGKDWCVVMADIDNFEAFNTAFGRQAGDDALRMAGDRLAEGLAVGEMAGRWSEDTFVCLYRADGAKDYVPLAEKMRAAFGQAGVWQGQELVPLSASVGLAVFGPGEETRTVLRRAVALVKQSKERGKNRSTVQRPFVQAEEAREQK